MNNNEKVMFLKQLTDVGIVLLAEWPGPQGNIDTFLKPEEVPTYIADPPAFWAKQYGGTKEQFVAWCNSHGDVYCAGTTRAGRPCQHIAATESDSLERWLELHGSYCHIHQQRSDYSR